MAVTWLGEPGFEDSPTVRPGPRDSANCPRLQQAVGRSHDGGISIPRGAGPRRGWAGIARASLVPHLYGEAWPWVGLKLRALAHIGDCGWKPGGSRQLSVVRFLFVCLFPSKFHVGIF